MSISSVSGINSSYTSTSRSTQRPDPSTIADDIFSKLDTKGQGYIDKSDLQSALDSLSGASSTSSNSGSSSSADALFSQLDSDNDGKITKSEMESGMQKLARALDSHSMHARMHGHHHGSSDATQTDGTDSTQQLAGMPPPPPQNGAGMTKDQLTSMADSLSSSDSKRASFMSDVASNFDKADTDGDGKVTFKEAMAYEKSQKTDAASTDSSASTSTSDGSATTAQESQQRMMQQLMQLIRAYGSSDQSAQASSISAIA